MSFWKIIGWIDKLAGAIYETLCVVVNKWEYRYFSEKFNGECPYELEQAF